MINCFMLIIYAACAPTKIFLLYYLLFSLSLSHPSQTSNPTESPFTSMTSYQKWEDFLANELEEISHEQSLYNKAGDLLSSAYQTGEHWVQVNLELVAVYGSIYGILISFSLCSLVVAVLSHNWRIVLSMFLTIMAILFSLLGLFSMFGWKLGIVEAVSLSILVGNALDYCIHLSEGYMAVDKRHLAFVDRFKVNSFFRDKSQHPQDNQ